MSDQSEQPPSPANTSKPTKPTHRFQSISSEGTAPSPEGDSLVQRISKSLEGVITDVFVAPAQDLLKTIDEATSREDHQAAFSALENANDRGHLGPLHHITESLVVAANNIQLDRLSEENQKRLRELRIGLAYRAQRFDLVERDARDIIAQSHAPPFGEKVGGAHLVMAHAAATKGNRETAIARYRAIIANEAFRPADRAWALRGLVKTLGGNSSECEELTRQSIDAFLQAQRIDEAIRSTINLVRAEHTHDPEAAMKDAADAEQWAGALPEADRRFFLPETLRELAAVAFRIGKFDVALAKAKAALGLGFPLQAETRSVLLAIAAKAASRTGATEDAAAFQAQLETHTHSIVGGDEKTRLDFVKALESGASTDLPPQLLDSMRQSSSPLVQAALATREALAREDMSLADRLEILESAQNRLGNQSNEPDVATSFAAAFSAAYLKADLLAEALPFCQRMLALDPTDWIAITNVAAILEKLSRWSDLAEHLLATHRRIGDRPFLLYKLGEALHRSGKPGESARYLSRCLKLRLPDPMRQRAQALLDQIHENGEAGAYDEELPAKPKPVSRADFRAALEEFARVVSGTMRQSFWEQENRKYKWRPSPEAIATLLLRAFLAGRFRDRALVINELRAGAGFIDIYVRFDERTAFIAEAKMCGDPYTLSYAQKGLEQLEHYASNRSGMGFLVVFDGRRREFGIGLEDTIVREGLIIETIRVDVRPEASAPEKPPSPGHAPP